VERSGKCALSLCGGPGRKFLEICFGAFDVICCFFIGGDTLLFIAGRGDVSDQQDVYLLQAACANLFNGLMTRDSVDELSRTSSISLNTSRLSAQLFSLHTSSELPHIYK